MTRASAAGEQDALRGYGYQYDHIAAAVYDLYLAGRGFELRLVDPEAGAVDDCVLVLQPRVAGAQEEVHGYQYKSGSGNLTLAGLLPAILEIPQVRSLNFPSWLRAQRVVAEVSVWGSWRHPLRVGR